jgi:hypothetical protein
MLHFPAQRSPYPDDPEEIAKELELAQENLRDAWRQHHAWTSIDCMNMSDDVELEYCVVAKLAAELLDDNCIGIYVPQENSFLANGGSPMPTCRIGRLFENLQLN